MDSLALSVATFVVAALYSSVGHGGASGYLAMMALAGVPHDKSSTTALLLNVVVATLSFTSFRGAGHFRLALAWPFLCASVPAAFVGGFLRVDRGVHSVLLGLALAFAALRMWMDRPSPTADAAEIHPSVPARMAVGGGIGLLSGMLGIGGGVFLSPLVMFLSWATVKQAAALSACFILVNSLAGLVGRASVVVESASEIGLMLACAVAGGLLGSRLGAFRFPSTTVRRVLGAVLASASVKLVLG